MGNRIEGVKAMRRFKHQATLRSNRSQNDWRVELSDIGEEACTSNYLDSYRAAAICLRIALENIVNIHLLQTSKDKPEDFGSLEKKLKKAEELPGSRLGTSAKECADYIRRLGNGAAHPGAPDSVLPIESNVVKGIKKLEDLIELVNVR